MLTFTAALCYIVMTFLFELHQGDSHDKKAFHCASIQMISIYSCPLDPLFCLTSTLYFITVQSSHSSVLSHIQSFVFLHPIASTQLWCMHCSTFLFSPADTSLLLLFLLNLHHYFFLYSLFILHNTHLEDYIQHSTTHLFHNTTLSSNVSVVFPSSSSVPA